MAGTITVGELLSDATSSNKITIGSGTTLDLKASAGSTTMPTGSVLQVVSGVSIARDTTNSTTFVASSLSASITPSSTSSKIFVIISTSGNTNNASNHWLKWTIYRDSTDLGGAITGSGMGQLRTTASGADVRGSITPSILDSPNTTSAVTYKLYFLVTNSAATVEIPGTVGERRTITLMEIAG